ncbi:hypothetical protein B0T11DRAFT_356771 [Plectosphaerella cucumerina]|uniref:LNR domain-containing protein n=1 Tax=Plectosphaerella cucumerina TaxID=40658 RepID=A0A8K0TDR2_9PEZI|nr:hypothetical protein B0T11DRAFT_356771 [Plectosphaerella cucumerina]
MQIIAFASAVLALAAGVTADLHNVAVCVDQRTSSPIGGTGSSVSYNWAKAYVLNPTATKCACDLYKRRNTGNKQWDQCPDCWFDGVYCNSGSWHIGGDEMDFYCSKRCGAQGAEANPS